MPKNTPTTPLLAYLNHSLTSHGWFGRMFGATQWLLGGICSCERCEPITVVSIRRNVAPEKTYEGFALLRKENIPFQAVLVDVVRDVQDLTTLEKAVFDADIHLVFATDTPWYTVFNLAAACTNGNYILFLDGEATPKPGLLAAYREVFETHPETMAARGVLQVPGLEDCICQTTGSFVLANETEYWPVDMEENMAVYAEDFFAVGGFDESLIGGYGALDLSIRLFGRKPDCHCQRYVPLAQLNLPESDDSGLPMERYLLQRQRSWIEIDYPPLHYNRLELYIDFWQKHCGEKHLD